MTDPLAASAREAAAVAGATAPAPAAPRPPLDLAGRAAAAGCDLVDLRFTDMLGRFLGVTAWARGLDAGALALPAASSSVAGWSSLENSDFLLRADPAIGFRDPFAQRPTLLMLGEALDAGSGAVSAMDARATLRRALAALVARGIADELRVGAELEFYLFDDVRFRMAPTECFFRVDEGDALDNAGRARRGGNPGHRIGYPSQHMAGPPLDSAADWRGGLLALAETIGLEPLRHQHEAGPSQQEIVLRHAPALVAADRIQIGKYLTLNAAAAVGKTATFMPKPLPYQPGSGLHLNLSFWRDGAPLLAGPDGLALARHVVGGLFAHARALNAFTNPGTNGYKRLAQLYHPNLDLVWGPGNRAAAIRVPIAERQEAARLELRFPDAAANPYLALAAIVMAAIDGVRRRLDPGPPSPRDPRRAAEAAWDIRRRATTGFAGDLGEAAAALAADDAFLREDDVFAPALLAAFGQELNRQVRVNRALPHPNEYYMYFSV